MLIWRENIKNMIVLVIFVWNMMSLKKKNLLIKQQITINAEWTTELCLNSSMIVVPA